MNLRFVEAFYWAVTLESVTRAAEKMFITQSALSSRIAALEDDLGVLLFDRRTRQVRLTVAGHRFYGLAQRLLDLQSQVRAEMGAGSVEPGVLRVGAIESVVHTWLTPWLQSLREGQGAIELDLMVETSPVLVEHVRRGTLDVAFTAMAGSGEGVAARAMPPLEMVFVGHAVLHASRAYTLADLARFDIMTFQRASQPHVALLDVFRTAGVVAPRIHSVSSISAMTQLVEGSFGVATLPRLTAQRLAHHQPLRILQCDATLPALPIHATFRDDPGSPAPRQAVDAAQRFVEAWMSTHR